MTLTNYLKLKVSKNLLTFKDLKLDTTMKNYLFICMSNRNRSVIAEHYFRELLAEKRKEGVVVSAGVTLGSRNPVTQEMIDRADKVFVMEESLYEELSLKLNIDRKKVVNLDIQDVYFAPRGTFSEHNLGCILDRMTDLGMHTEVSRISQKDELMNGYDLIDVLKSRNLEQYI